MTRALLLTTDGKCESVTIPTHVEEYAAMCEIIGADEYYQGILMGDTETERTIFIFMDAYNDGHSGTPPPLNTFIAQHSAATIYGNVLLYVSEPFEAGGDDEIIYDLDLSVPQLEILMRAVDLRNGIFTPHVLFEVLDDTTKLAEMEEVLMLVGIHNHTE
jgi:hypothetical protein